VFLAKTRGNYEFRLIDDYKMDGGLLRVYNDDKKSFIVLEFYKKRDYIKSLKSPVSIKVKSSVN
jgi:hypothetical protein